MEIKHYTAVDERHRIEFSNTTQENSKQRKQDAVIRINRVDSPLADEALYQKAAAIWVNSSISMSSMLAARHVPYSHFIQPNQYYSTGKKFTEQERRIAFTENGESEYLNSI